MTTGLSAFVPKTTTVTIPDGITFSVRGLALEDLTILVRSHYLPMFDLFQKYVGEASLARVDKATGSDLDLADMESVVLNALEMAPPLIGDLIARATGETENPHIARLLPIAVQIDTVGKIVALTLEAEGGMEKLMGTINNLIASVSVAAQHRSP